METIPTVRCSSKFLWQLSAISSLTLTSFCFIFSLYSVFLSLSDFEIIKLIVNSLSAAFIEMPLKKENLKNAFFRVWVPNHCPVKHLSKMELFAKIAISLQLQTIFTKSFILDVWQGSEYAFLFFYSGKRLQYVLKTEYFHSRKEVFGNAKNLKFSKNKKIYRRFKFDY